MKQKSLLLAIAASATLLCSAAGLLPYQNTSLPIEERVNDALSRMTTAEKVAIIHAQSKFSSAGVPRLGIPELWCTDGPHGVRPEVLWDEWNQAGWTNDSCTAFPALTCLAATWNPEMSALYGKSIGEEARYREKDVLLGPGVNIYRTPLNGRNFEYMGEDPYLAAVMVVPYVQELQKNGVAACVKHYALNNQEYFRHTVDVDLSDRALYEIYLPAFKAAVQKGGAWSIMSSYNLYKGLHAGQNPRLLKEILRDEWGFDGAVISDWGGVHNTAQAITGGLDLEFGSWTNGLSEGKKNAYDSYYLADPYLKLISEGKVDTKELDKKAANVLRLIFRTAMNNEKPFGSLNTPEHVEAARRIAGEGIVLLKNEGAILPLDMSGKKMADKKQMDADGTITFSINVKNTGKIAGKETVQLYISDKKSSLPRPVKELKGFSKVELAPGEEKTVTFTVGKEELSYFDDAKHAWVAEPGTFEALFGSSSRDIRGSLTFKLTD